MSPPDDAPSGTVVDDNAVLLRNHAGQRILRHQECSFEVDVDLLVPFLFGALKGIVRIENTGVIEEDVEATEGLDRFVYGALAFRGPANIGAKEDCLAAGFEDAGGYGVSSFLVASGDGDGGALLWRKEERWLLRCRRCRQ